MNKTAASLPVFHGGALDRAIASHGGKREEWLDLSTGINPRAYALAALSRDAWTRLPDSNAQTRLTDAARRHYGVPDKFMIVATPGTQALIEALPRLLPGTTSTIIATLAGTYREHAHCAAKAGRAVRHAGSPQAVAQNETMATLVHPNNPDGHFWDPGSVVALAGRLAPNGGTIVIDEAFCDTDPSMSFVGEMPQNAVLLKSVGKFFGLAGIRLGFVVAAPQMAQRIEEWFGPWAVSGPALEAGALALNDTAWVVQTREWLARESAALVLMLQAQGFEIAGRNGLFVLTRHANATTIAQALLKAQILVRPFGDRKDLLRFGLGPEGNERLGMALRRILGDL